MEVAYKAGEVIEAGTTRFVAQCPPGRLHLPPDFGSFVKILPPGHKLPSSPDRSLVADEGGDFSADRQSAASFDEGTHALLDEDPFADPITVPNLEKAIDAPDGTLYAIIYHALTGSIEPGRRAAAYGLDEEQLHREQPQIVALLATEFAALHVGHVHEGRLRPHLPPRPPRLHAQVWECTPAESMALTESTDFLRPLLSSGGEADPDELIAACLRTAYVHRQRDMSYLIRMGKQLAMLLRDDPDRLTALLRKLEP